jgi:hypothetical protein
MSISFGAAFAVTKLPHTKNAPQFPAGGSEIHQRTKTER